jgi:AbrB family looped-hinge helix DNA binding protein
MHYKGVITLPLVKIKEKYQITIPAEVRDEMRLSVGDILEATVEDNVIVLKPKAVVDREQAWMKIERAMASVEDLAPNPNQSPKEEEEDIARMVKEYRKHHAQRRS